MSEPELTPADAMQRVEQCRQAIEKDDDNETAHIIEDNLRDEVLKAIASGSTKARELAEIALSTNRIEFTRWHS